MVTCGQRGVKLVGQCVVNWVNSYFNIILLDVLEYGVLRASRKGASTIGRPENGVKLCESLVKLKLNESKKVS